MLAGSLIGYSYSPSDLARRICGGAGLVMSVITGLVLIRLCLDLCTKFGVDDIET